MKRGIVAPRFVSKYMQNSIAYTGTVLWNREGGVSPYYCLFQERGTIFRLKLYNRVEISQVKVYERLGKPVI